MMELVDMPDMSPLGSYSPGFVSFGTNKKFNPLFLQFPKTDPLVSIQISGICVKPRGSPLTKPAKVGFALVETPQQFSFSVKIQLCQIALPTADF